LRPEEKARHNIDKMLKDAGWSIQHFKEMDLSSSLGVAVREFPLSKDHADYLLFLDRQAVGVIEAKPEGTTLSGVAEQTESYLTNLPDNLPHASNPLPFAYESTGIEIYFRDMRDLYARSRRVFYFHRPETLFEGLSQDHTLRTKLKELNKGYPLIEEGLRDCQIEAIKNLEKSFATSRPRSLIQMATGSGKTFTAVSFVYRLIKYAGAKRILFLVDRKTLGSQTSTEFQNYATPDDGRKFTNLYNVQHLTTNAIDPVSKVVITTIQRLYSILKGDQELDEEYEEVSLFDRPPSETGKPLEVSYNPRIPIETF
jgi:type I restriction enzyme, R subunit